MKKRVNQFVMLIVVISLICGFVFTGNVGAQTKKPYNIEIYTFMVGTSTYAFGVALAQFINEKSSWLKATAVEIPRPTVTARMMIEKPGMKEKMIGFINTEDPRIGYPPFDKYKPPYDGLRNIAAYGSVFNGVITLDPNIKKMSDFSGKRIGLGLSPSAARVDIPKGAIIASGAKNVKFSEYSFTAGVRAIKDGLIQGLLTGAFLRDPVTGKHVPNPAFSQVLSTAKTYFVSFEKGTYDNICKEQGRRLSEYIVPPGGLGPAQTVPWRVAGGPIGWGGDKAIPNDVVYEFTRIMAENAHRFGDFHPSGKSITPERMAKMGTAAKYIHEGALRYYKEAGLDKYIGRRWME
jgi:TRAP transporter TAXI family solute receptor